MRTLMLTLVMLLSLASCNDDKTNENNKGIVGTWKLISTYGSDGGSIAKWSSVDKGYTYTFNSDGTFTSTRFSECTQGTHTLNPTSLILNFGCNGFDTKIETPAGTFSEKISYENENVILTPSYLMCDEGCAYKFEKVAQ